MSTPEKLIKPCFVLLQPVTPKVNTDFSSELRKAINERNLLTTKTRKRVTEALEEIEHENYENTKHTKREKILNEILESEENYIRQLEVIVEFFIKPTQERILLKPRDFDILFRDLTSIYNINKELLDELHKTNNNVAKAFSKIAPFFKSYSFYALGFKRSLEFLQDCRKHNPEFEKFIEMQESRPEVQSKLSALLIVPIQRVPRYKLLLTSLFNLTSPSEADYESLLDSLRKVENAAEHINQVIKEQENMQRLLELQRCLQNGEPKVITPGRHLIKEGQLLRLTDKAAHSQKMHVVLMNDIIMFCKMKKDELLKANSLKCSSIYPLNKCKVSKIQDKGAFKVICQQEEIVLFSESYAETIQWVDEIENAVETYINDRKTLRKENTVRRPVKRKDLAEYNEIGLSPGKKMRKRKTFFEESEFSRPTFVAKRRPLRTNFNLSTYSQSSSPSFFVTLKPPQAREPEENSHTEISRELFVFGQPHPDTGFSFKMNKWLCGIGSSVKKFFGFK